MQLSVDQQSGIAVVTVNGSVDSADSDALLSFFDELIQDGQTRLIADLSQMDFIVSMGLGVFVQIYTRLRNTGGFLRLAGPQPLVLLLIKTTGLDRLLPIYDSLPQALK